MSTSHFQRVKSLFQQALDLDPETWDQFICDRCDDDQMQRDVAALLKAHQSATGFLASPLNQSAIQANSDRWIGKSIDGFQLEAVIGVGGHATVYRASQCQPRRRVALKMLHPLHFQPAWVQRFRDESDILAQLDDPGIATVYASGQVNDQNKTLNWIAMELIDGLPLDRYVAEQELDVRSKLILLQRICNAVAHAHQRGIVHRDLKPSNILVAQSKTEMRPVIVDFGIARVLGESVSDRNTTVDGTVLGTFTHMSPEQLAGDVERINTSSDVYALGVIGFEMLSGMPPIDMKRGSLRDVIERGVNQHPVMLGQLNRYFKGDVEAIIAMALEKDQECRYVSAAAMAEDLDDHLNGREISAKRPSMFNRVVRFVRRNRGPVLATGSVLAVTIAGAAFYFDAARRATIEAENARYEADKAIAVNSFITNDLVTNIIGGLSGGSSTTREEVALILEQTAAKTDTMFGDRPPIEAAVRNELGSMWYSLGRFDQAQEEYVTARRLWSQVLGEHHPDTLKAMNNLALCWMHLGQQEQAEPLMRTTLAARRDVLGDSNEQTLATMNNLAEMLSRSGRLDEAQQLLTEAYERQLGIAGFENKQSLIFAANLGTHLMRCGNEDQALDLHRRVFSGCQLELGTNHVTTRKAGFRYAQTLYALKRYADALQVFEPIYLMTQDDLTNESISSARLLSRIQRNLGNVTEAKRVLEKALATAESKPMEFEDVIAKLRRDLARL